MTWFTGIIDMSLSILPDSYAKATQVVRATLKEFSLLPHFAISFPFTHHAHEAVKLEKLRVRLKKRSTKRPILFIHGFFHNSTAWNYLLGGVEKKGLGPLYTVDLGSPFLSIEEYSKRVALKVDLIKRAHGRSDVTIVAHSMGGLVGAHYAVTKNRAVRKIITLGTPAQGTIMAHLLRVLSLNQCLSAKEMTPESKLLQELHKKIRSHKMKIAHFCSKSDIIVPSCESASFPIDRVNTRVFDDMGHLQYLRSEKVLEALIEELRV